MPFPFASRPCTQSDFLRRKAVQRPIALACIIYACMTLVALCLALAYDAVA